PQRSKGREADSEQTLLRAIAASESALGREHPQTASIMEQLGMLYNAMEDHSKAEPLILEATAIVERTLGESPRLAICHRDLALLYMHRGETVRGLAELPQARATSDSSTY